MTKTTAALPETIIVPADAERVRCDGGDGALGHPRVYYSFNGKNQVVCGYCGRAFVKEQ